MNKLKLPFGNLEVKLDGKNIDFNPIEFEKEDNMQYVVKRYFIPVKFMPDGKEHRIDCLVDNVKIIDSGVTCDEDYSAWTYDIEGDRNVVVSVLEDRDYEDLDFEPYHDGNKVSMSVHILSTTKAETYVFGIAWVDNISKGDKEHLTYECELATDSLYYIKKYGNPNSNIKRGTPIYKL